MFRTEPLALEALQLERLRSEAITRADGYVTARAGKNACTMATVPALALCRDRRFAVQRRLAWTPGKKGRPTRFTWMPGDSTQ